MSNSDEDEDRKHDLDWTNVPVEKARQVFDLGQTHLQAQLQAALAADARATALAGLFVTLGSAALAAGLGYFQARGSWSVLAAAVTAAAFFLFAGYRSAWAARPVVFYMPGNQPEQWFKCLNDDLPTLLGGQSELDDRDIRRNDRLLQQNARAVHDAIALATIAPIFAFGAWGFTALFFE